MSMSYYKTRLKNLKEMIIVGEIIPSDPKGEEVKIKGEMAEDK